MIAVHQRVFNKKAHHRRIGVVVDVEGDRARVQWDDSPASPPQLSKLANLTVVDIQCGASVIFSSEIPRPPTICQFPPLGIVMDLSTSTTGTRLCTVSWDNASVTTHSAIELYDIEWIPSIPLGKQTIQEWITTFQARHHVDIITTRNASMYRCRRNHHVKDCQCKKNVADSCKCRFRITVDIDGTVKLSGRHTHHIPGEYINITDNTVIDMSLTHHRHRH
jgi:hypothetical protein